MPPPAPARVPRLPWPAPRTSVRWMGCRSVPAGRAASLRTRLSPEVWWRCSPNRFCALVKLSFVLQPGFEGDGVSHAEDARAPLGGQSLDFCDLFLRGFALHGEGETTDLQPGPSHLADPGCPSRLPPPSPPARARGPHSRSLRPPPGRAGPAISPCARCCRSRPASSGRAGRRLPRRPS